MQNGNLTYDNSAIGDSLLLNYNLYFKILINNNID